MLQTRLTTDYGIDVPIVSAGMAFVARAPLAGAVSAAGGLGVLGATAMPPEVLQADIDAIRAETDRPFGANFIARFGAADQVELCARERVPVVVFYWDPPEDGWVDLLRDAGTKVWMQVGSPDEAAAAVDLGVRVRVPRCSGPRHSERHRLRIRRSGPAASLRGVGSNRARTDRGGRPVR